MVFFTHDMLKYCLMCMTFTLIVFPIICIKAMFQAFAAFSKTSVGSDLEYITPGQMVEELVV